MIEVKNILFQPLSFQLEGGEDLHLGSRGRKQIEATQISKELKLAEKRGLVSLREISATPPAPLTETRRTRKGAKS